MKQSITTYNTKKMLAESLKKAMARKAFSKITVVEIIEDCGVNRKTFYYHFEDIYALLKWMFEEEAIDVVKHFDLLVDYKSAICFVMDYIDKNDYIINCAYDSIGRDEMKRFFSADFTGVITSVINAAEDKLGKQIDPSFKEFAARFYTEAISGILIDWIKNKDRSNREKTVEYLEDIIEASLLSMHLYIGEDTQP